MTIYPIPTSQLDHLWKALGFVKDEINAFYELVGVDPNDEDIKANHFTVKNAQKFFDKWEEDRIKDNKTMYSIFKVANDFMKAMVSCFQRYCRYSAIDTQELQAVITQLKNSGNSQFDLVVLILENIVSSDEFLSDFIATTEGFNYTECVVVAALKDAVTKIPTVGVLFQGMQLGFDISNGLFNVDGVQAAAFNVNHAVSAAKAYLPQFERFYENFKEHPTSDEGYEDFHQALKLFSEMVGMEYETFGEFVGTYNDAEVNKLLGDLLNSTDPEKQIKSCDLLADDYRNMMRFDLEEFKYWCFGGTEPVIAAL